MSLPIAPAHSPAATAAPEPLDDPAGSCARFHGLRAGGNGVSNAVPPIANSQVVNLPNSTAPAWFSSLVVVAFVAGTRPRQTFDPPSVGTPAVS